MMRMSDCTMSAAARNAIKSDDGIGHDQYFSQPSQKGTLSFLTQEQRRDCHHETEKGRIEDASNGRYSEDQCHTENLDWNLDYPILLEWVCGLPPLSEMGDR